MLRAVRSALPQLQSKDQIIVVDNFSSDDTQEVITHLLKHEEQVTYLKLHKNLGAMGARNIGIQAARADWVAFLDSDDEYVAHGLEHIRAATELKGHQSPILQFKTEAITGEAEYAPRGYCPKNSWITYQPTYDDIVLKNDIFGDMHRCIERRFCLANLYDSYNPDCETYHYSKIAKRQIPIYYFNQLVVRIDETSAHRHSLNVVSRFPKAYMSIYLRMLNEHRDVFSRNILKRQEMYSRISKIAARQGRRQRYLWKVRCCVSKIKDCLY